MTMPDLTIEYVPAVRYDRGQAFFHPVLDGHVAQWLSLHKGCAAIMAGKGYL